MSCVFLGSRLLAPHRDGYALGFGLSCLAPGERREESKFVAASSQSEAGVQRIVVHRHASRCIALHRAASRRAAACLPAVGPQHTVELTVSNSMGGERHQGQQPGSRVQRVHWRTRSREPSGCNLRPPTSSRLEEQSGKQTFQSLLATDLAGLAVGVGLWNQECPKRLNPCGMV